MIQLAASFNLMPQSVDQSNGINNNPQPAAPGLILSCSLNYNISNYRKSINVLKSVEIYINNCHSHIMYQDAAKR
jgi:hypothetical protein